MATAERKKKEAPEDTADVWNPVTSDPSAEEDDSSNARTTFGPDTTVLEATGERHEEVEVRREKRSARSNEESF